MNEEIRYVILIIELVILSIQDIKGKKISTIALAVMILCAGAMRIMGVAFLNENLFENRIITGIIFGALITIFGHYSRVIGEGDGIVIILVALMSDGIFSIGVFIAAITLAAVAALILLVLKKAKKTYEIPFVPFLLFSMIGVFVCI